MSSINQASPPITDLGAFVGRIVAFVGVDDSDRSIGNLALVRQLSAAAFKIGIDSLCFRRGNGTYPIPSRDYLIAERDACHEAGCGWIPYLYAYGPRFGDPQIAGECAHLAALGEINGVVVADLEAEWDGQFRAGDYFEQLMRPVACKLGVTSWANPISHNFPVRQIAACVDAWIPMDYSDYLGTIAAQQVASGETVRYPAVDIRGPEFGANHPVSIVSQMPCASIWLWELSGALAHADVVAALRQTHGWSVSR